MRASNPRIGVIMPVYNTEKYVAEAIESILNQTFTDFELIIINDCSTDRTPEIIAEYALKDQRIRLINNPQNSGPAKSRNDGILQSHGIYIALMDADDISHPDRLEKQVAYLDHHQEVMVLGSSVQKIDSAGNPLEIWRLPVQDRIIRWHILFRNSKVFCNPAIMHRKTLFNIMAMYNKELKSFIDSELWTRIFDHKDIDLANSPENLLDYRVHSDSITFRRSEEQRIGSRDVRAKLLAEFLGRQINIKSINAYESGCALEKSEIPEIICTWFETYQKYIKEFKVSVREKLIIFTEILVRIVGYVNFRGSNNKVKLADLRSYLSAWQIVSISAMVIYSWFRNRRV